VSLAYDILAGAARRWPNKVAVRTGENRHTFSQLDAQADRLADALESAGVTRGDRVALISKNDPIYYTAQAAVIRLGAAVVPVNWRLAADEIRYIIQDSDPKVLLVGAGYEDLATDLSTQFPPVTLMSVSEQAWLRQQSPRPSHRRIIDPDLTATITYTSGTTGRPKGTMISSRALLARMFIYGQDSGISSETVFLQCLPMFHIAAINAYSVAYFGGEAVLVDGFEVGHIDDVIRSNRVTHVSLVPTMISDLARAATGPYEHPLRILYGASAMPVEVLREGILVLGCVFSQSFGQTETGLVCSLSPEQHEVNDLAGVLSSIGQPVPGAELAVVDADGHELPPGVAGEIVARGPGMMSGYWRNPHATAEAIRDGWNHTGDVGYFSSQGFLYIVDRLKDMIISGGENVYSSEVERVLRMHEAVRDAAVVGAPDPRWGEAVHAFVVLDKKIQADDLQAFCRRYLAGYKVPKRFSFCNEFPRNSTGKVMKQTLRSWAVAEITTASTARSS
jgi:acyl-CoA synthetase (AMP-forming)/AMP-acid ligase II